MSNVMIEEFPFFLPGTKWQFDYGENNVNNKLVHILVIVDEGMIVYKWWSGSRWNYQVKGYYYFVLTYRRGYLYKKE